MPAKAYNSTIRSLAKERTNASWLRSHFSGSISMWFCCLDSSWNCHPSRECKPEDRVGSTPVVDRESSWRWVGGHAAAAAAKSLQSCLTLCDPIRQPTRLPRPWDSPGKHTGVGCHGLLQCMKVKNESEVAQSCPTLHDPMDCSPPGSSTHGIFPGKSTGVGCH